jgi:hypothetical protein
MVVPCQSLYDKTFKQIIKIIYRSGVKLSPVITIFISNLYGEEIGKLVSQRKLRKCITYIVIGVMGFGV